MAKIGDSQLLSRTYRRVLGVKKIHCTFLGGVRGGREAVQGSGRFSLPPYVLLSKVSYPLMYVCHGAACDLTGVLVAGPVLFVSRT